MTTPAEQYRALVNRLEAIQEDGIFKGKGNGLLGQMNIPTRSDASTPGTSEYRRQHDMTKDTPEAHSAAQQLLTIFSKIDPASVKAGMLDYNMQKAVQAYTNAHMRDDMDTVFKLKELWQAATGYSL